MNNIKLKYQISLFGAMNFDNNQENIIKLMQLLIKYSLFPSYINEMDINTISGQSLSRKILRLNNPNTNFTIIFAMDRIDFVQEPLDLKSTNFTTLDEFITDVTDIVKILIKNKLLPAIFNRVALVTDELSTDLSDDTLANIYKDLHSSFFDSSRTAKDWSINIGEIEAFNDESINVLKQLSKIEGTMVVSNQAHKLKGLKLLFDINTLFEKNEYRFTEEKLIEFFQKAKEIRENDLEIIKNKIKELSNE